MFLYKSMHGPLFRPWGAWSFLLSLWSSTCLDLNSPLLISTKQYFTRTCMTIVSINTVSPVLSGHSQKDQQWVFKTNYRLMQVKSIAECSKGSILQCFRLAFSYHMALRPLFCLFLSGRLSLVSLYFAEGSKQIVPDFVFWLNKWGDL